MKMIEKLRELYKDEDYFDPYILAEETEDWPEIPEDSFDDYDDDDKEDEELDEEKYLEPLDLENYKITEIGDDYLIIKCGGDWQSPYEVKIELNSDDELEVSYYELTDFGEGSEIDMNELLELE